MENKEEIDLLKTYWNSCLTTPRLLEWELIEELYYKFGLQKAKHIIRDLAENGFKKVKTMREALNSDGSIKPKDWKDKPFYETDPLKGIK